MAIHILGIRHHGPGSAKNVRSFLEKLQPDIVLVEGPPEADELLQWVIHEDIKPPVALLVYQPENPQQASFYPFAEFSPEWQAIRYAKQQNIHVRFMDLPIAHVFALQNEERKQAEEQQKKQEEADAENEINTLESIDETVANGISNSLHNDAMPIDLLPNDEASTPTYTNDPISFLADAAGFSDGESWWEHTFEYRQNDEQVFEAVAEAMQALRETLPQKEDRKEQLREAHMRKTIRQAEKEMFQNIAVVCGAWHVPALINMPKAKDDNDLLKGLPKVKVECTWVPWTYGRLSYSSGYGAGIPSPGWYEHIWKSPTDDGTRWMAKVAQLFRSKEMDTSVAHVMEAVRLANSLASLRHISRPGLEELNEATLSVLCNGEPILLQLIHDELIVSNTIGEVPTDIPKPPLQSDIEKIQKRLRLPATADWKDYTLDLRKENDLERSVFLHRLLLLGINWGQSTNVSGKGTFKEQWRLQWNPDFSIDVIEKGIWGNTVEVAANSFVTDLASKSTSLAGICDLLQKTIPAELSVAIETLIQSVNNLAATSGDVIQLMEAVPPLVNVSRYGNVRNTDATMVLGIVESMVARICISLPAACTAVNDDAAQHLLSLFSKMNDALNMLQHADMNTQWHQTLFHISQSKSTSPSIGGYATRLLADYRLLIGNDLAKAFGYAMSSATLPAIAASWLEGFLKGSGTLLLLDNDLWSLVNNWVDTITEENFVETLPLLRRTFANFTNSERRKLGEKVKHGDAVSAQTLITTFTDFDIERAKRGIPVVMQLFGYSKTV